MVSENQSVCLLVVLGLFIGCGGGSNTAEQDAQHTQGEAGLGGAGGSAPNQPGDCYTGTAPAPSSTIRGSGFDAWEGESVHGCFNPAQSFVPGCADGIIQGGQFELTASACTGVGWSVDIDHARTCYGDGTITPANCFCYGGFAGGYNCDAGVDVAIGAPMDASGDVPSEVTSEASPAAD